MSEQQAIAASTRDGWHATSYLLVFALFGAMVTSIVNSQMKEADTEAVVASTVERLSTQGEHFFYQNEEYEVVALEGDIVAYKPAGSRGKAPMRAALTSIARECIYQAPAGGESFAVANKNSPSPIWVTSLRQSLRKYLRFPA